MSPQPAKPARTGEESSQSASLRIGDVARLAGTTPRTIRYYEEIGLLPEAPARPSGRHAGAKSLPPVSGVLVRLI